MKIFIVILRNLIFILKSVPGASRILKKKFDKILTIETLCLVLFNSVFNKNCTRLYICYHTTKICQTTFLQFLNNYVYTATSHWTLVIHWHNAYLIIAIKWLVIKYTAYSFIRIFWSVHFVHWWHVWINGFMNISGKKNQLSTFLCGNTTDKVHENIWRQKFSINCNAVIKLKSEKTEFMSLISFSNTVDSFNLMETNFRR